MSGMMLTIVIPGGKRKMLAAPQSYSSDASTNQGLTP